MDFKKQAWVLAVIEQLRKQGSWTGKTHLQKTLFLMRAATDSAPPFEFVLYRHGPYSFDAEAELEEMKSYGAVVVEPVPSYGVTLKPGGMAHFAKTKSPLLPAELKAVVKVCKFVGNRDVAALERLATAAWIRKIEGITSPQKVAARLNELKPHITIENAKAADQELTRSLLS